jgi:hypothetical protein
MINQHLLFGAKIQMSTQLKVPYTKSRSPTDGPPIDDYCSGSQKIRELYVSSDMTSMIAVIGPDRRLTMHLSVSLETWEGKSRQFSQIAVTRILRQQWLLQSSWQCFHSPRLVATFLHSQSRDWNLLCPKLKIQTSLTPHTHWWATQDVSTGVRHGLDGR